MSDVVKQAIETRDIFTLRQIAATAVSEQKLVLQLLADLIEGQRNPPTTGTARTA